MDLTRVHIDELVVDGAPSHDAAALLHSRVQAAVLQALRERGLSQKSASASAARVADELVRRVSA